MQVYLSKFFSLFQINALFSGVGSSWLDFGIVHH